MKALLTGSIQLDYCAFLLSLSQNEAECRLRRRRDDVRDVHPGHRSWEGSGGGSISLFMYLLVACQ